MEPRTRRLHTIPSTKGPPIEELRIKTTKIIGYVRTQNTIFFQTFSNEDTED